MENILFVQSPSRYKNFYEYKPHIIQKLKRISWFKNFSDEDLTVRTNAAGLRERFDYPQEKSENTFRIIALGNSFTAGFFVSIDNTYVELLEDLLNNQGCKEPKKFEVINLGVAGYDIAFSAERFRTRGIKYHPDIIAFLAIGGDFGKITDVFADTCFPKKNDPQFNRKNLHKTDQEAKKQYDELVKEKGEGNIFQYQMNAMKELIQSFKNKIVITTFNQTGPKVQYNHNTELKKLTKQYENAYFYEINKSLMGPDGFFPDLHPSKKGHKVIAKELLRFLNQQKLILCEK